jgi:phosphoglycerate dehydrogenase-like enzyme
VQTGTLVRTMSSTPVRIHIQTNPVVDDVYKITPAVLDSALRAKPDLEGQIDCSFGSDMKDLQRSLNEAEILFVQGRVDLGSLADHAPYLKWIQSTGAGVDKLLPNIPLGVAVTTTSGIHVGKGGEYALTALLMLNHRVPHFITAQREARWDQSFSTPIAGKTVVVLGTGAIGSEAARLARPFGVRLLGVNRSGQPNAAFDWIYLTADLPQILPLADFLLVILPLTRETRGLLNRTRLDMLGKRAGVINIGRGAVIDNDALADKLHKRELAGAVLDVFPEEPLPASSPLWSAPNAILSPHCAVDDAERYVERAVGLFVDNVSRYIKGQELTNVVDRALGY